MKALRPHSLDLAVFLLVGIAIVTAAWPGIDVQNFEIGDFAANSLLIQDAKHLALLKGNYSRIGFHHPGPAILYVLAFGELLFNDLLHLTKSAFSGQLIAGCFYTSAWIVVVWREFRKVSGSRWIGGCLASVFASFIAFFNYNFFSDIWFPNLYVFPFAAMSMAMARLASGRADSLITLAVSAGFLFNGHVSFVPIVGIVFVITMVANGVVHRRSPDARVSSAVFLRAHRRTIGVALGVLGLFFVPLLIETLVSFPGPVPGYLSFGAGGVVHPMRESLFYVADFWGGLAPMLGAFTAAALVVVAVRDLPVVRAAVVALIVVLASSTVALFVYARYGIDYLNLTYVAYYYYTTPALLFTTFVFAALSADRGARRTGVVLGLTLACLALTYWKIHRPVRDLDQYNQPEVVELYSAIKGAAVGGRIVLDLDNRQDFGHLWTNLVGAEAYARRRHEDLFCLNKNWHVLFTDAAHCTPDELLSRPRFTVRVGSTPQQPNGFVARGIGFTPYHLPDITDSGYLSVKANADAFNNYFLADGWSAPEGEYVWSSGGEAHLAFRVRPGFSGVVALDLGAFLVPGHLTVTGRTFVNDVATGAFEFNPERQRQVLELPVQGGEAGLDVRLVVDNPSSPRILHVGDDPRILGISLFGIEVKPR